MHAGNQATAVPPWPRLTAVLHSGTRATLVLNDTEHACEAPTGSRLRTGVLARAAAVATAADRPVRLRLVSGGGAQLLAVRPDGAVHALSDDGMMAPEALPSPTDATCRRCDAAQPLAAPTCRSCGTVEPHRVEVTPVPVLDVAALTAPDAEHAETLHARVVSAPGRPVARVSVEGGVTATFTGSAALGRNPAAAPGRTPVVLSSPGMLVSKTHAVIEVDEHGALTVTDNGSSNGTTIEAEPPLPLTPGRSYPISPGTTLRLGDVICRVDLEQPEGLA